MHAQPIDDTAGQQDVDLPRREVVRQRDAASADGRRDRVPAAEPATDAVELHALALERAVVIGSVGEGQRQDAEIDQILPVDAGETASDGDAQVEMARRECRVLAARSLAVIVAADDDMPACVATGERALGVAGVELLVDILAEGGDVAPERLAVAC